jgi:Ca2+/Na+ antiporter
MNIFGISIQDFIFSIFLPLVLFYLIFYALLRKSKVLGENKSLDAITALVLSALVVFGIYSLNTTQYLVNTSVAVAIACFIALFIYGTLKITLKKGLEYSKEEDTKRFEEIKRKGAELWEKFSKDPSLLPSLESLAKELAVLAKKLNKDPNEIEWYKNLKRYLEKGG